MSAAPIVPSTLDGIRRLAKSIKSTQGLQHAKALDEAARIAGHQNYSHAFRTLGGDPKGSVPPPGHRVFITVYWTDRDAKTKGRETLTIDLSIALEALLSPAHLRNARYLAGMRLEGPDHLVQQQYLASSQSAARSEACKAARTLTFMMATGLKPSGSGSRAYPGGDFQKAVPGNDHATIWFDPASKTYVYADEPYQGAVNHLATERAAWSQRHGYAIAKPSWEGMYSPDGGTELFLIAKKGYSLAPLVAALDRLPKPMAAADWNGESGPMSPAFVSPGSAAKAHAAQLIPKAAHVKPVPRNSVGFIQTFVGPRTRPAGKMPVEAHAEVGRLLKSVLISVRDRRPIYKRVDRMRSDLDEWVMREYAGDELPNEQFNGLYYHELNGREAAVPLPAGRDHHVGSLVSAKQILARHYPDSAPLRAMFKSADAAIDSLQALAPG